jgi:hypothetical protein
MTNSSLEGTTSNGTRIHILVSDVEGESDRTQINIDFSESETSFKVSKCEDFVTLYANNKEERIEILKILKTIVVSLENC